MIYLQRMDQIVRRKLCACHFATAPKTMIGFAYGLGLAIELKLKS